MWQNFTRQMLAYDCPIVLAAIPAGSPRPSAAVVIAVLVFLVLVIALNALWEALKGPPQP